MEEKWGWPGFVGAAIVICIFALLTVAASGGWPQLLTVFGALFSDPWGAVWAAWVQGVGGLAAVVTALYLATRGEVRKRAEELDRATLTAARLSQVIIDALHRLRQSQSTLEFAEPLGVENARYIKDSMKLVRSSLLRVPTSDLLNLVPLNNRAAHRLAKAIALMEGLADEIDGVTDWAPIVKGRFQHVADGWLCRLTEAIELFQVSKAELDQVVQEAAPHPSVTELHGDLPG